MKKLTLILTLALVFAMGTYALAGPGNGKGAVKTGLYERNPGDPADQAGSGDLSGFVVANSTAAGALNVNVQLKDGVPETVYDVYIKINGVHDGPSGQLTTDAYGEGEAQFQLDISDVEGDSVDVQVVVKPADVVVIVGYATDTVSVPLKK